MGDEKEAAVLLAQNIADKQPNNAQVRYLPSDMAIAAEDEAAIKGALKEVETVASQGPYWYYGQAMLLLIQAKESKGCQAIVAEGFGVPRQGTRGGARKDWSQISLAEVANL